MKEATKGMTQAEIAGLLKEKPHRVNAVMCGKQRVPEDFLIKFVEVFQVDANWLLLGIKSKPELNPREAILVDHYRNCDETGRDAMLRTGAALAKSRAGDLKKAE